MVDIARSPSVIRKKKIRRIIYGAVALARHHRHHRRRVAAEAGGADRRSRDRLGRHREARPDAAAGARLGHAGAGRHPLDSGDRRRAASSASCCAPARRSTPDTVILELSNPRARAGASSEAQLAYQSAQAAFAEPQGGTRERAAHAGSRTSRPSSRNYKQAELDLEANEQLVQGRPDLGAAAASRSAARSPS